MKIHEESSWAERPVYRKIAISFGKAISGSTGKKKGCVGLTSANKLVKLGNVGELVMKKEGR
jgi:hypothetical protein